MIGKIVVAILIHECHLFMASHRKCRDSKAKIKDGDICILKN